MNLRTVAVLMLAASLATACAAAAKADRSDLPTTKPSLTQAPATQPVADDVPAIPSGPRVAYIDLGKPIVEKPADFSFFATDETNSLRSLLDRLEKARDDKDVRAVLITLGGTGPNLSQALEIRDALLDLKKAGKRTFVYADAYDSPSYVMASGATDVCILGGGELEMPGVGLEVMFAKGLLDKIGVEADFEQIGEYKGADEEFIHTQPSPEMSGELNKLVDGLYAELIANISHNRNLPPEKVKAIVDQALIPADQAKECGLVDHLVDEDGLRDLMGGELGGKVDLVHDYGAGPKQTMDFSNPFALLAMFARKPDEGQGKAIALIYAQGVIVDGSTEDSLFGSSDQIGSDDLREALRIAERDDQISAVVLRIDSPGGSALASEAMWQAVRRCERTKPVIVSIGSMAASGGYYLASASETIYADPTAIVGSIGVVGGKFVLHDMFGKIGLSTTTFERGANAGLFSSDAPWTPQQRKMVHDWMHQTYEQFTTRVMTTRKGKIKEIDKVARGRIFLAEQAKDLGMVDAIGGVSDAITEAARQADLTPGGYDVRIVPGPKTLADFFNGGPDTQTPIQPNMLFSALPADQRSMLQEQIAVLRLFEARPLALVCPYVIRSR
jgi:protease IV